MKMDKNSKSGQRRAFILGTVLIIVGMFLNNRFNISIIYVIGILICSAVLILWILLYYLSKHADLSEIKTSSENPQETEEEVINTNNSVVDSTVTEEVLESDNDKYDSIIANTISEKEVEKDKEVEETPVDEKVSAPKDKDLEDIGYTGNLFR